jgi:hypothetical protein
VDSFFQVWVPVAYPEAVVECVARTFLWQRLLELAELAKASALADAAIGALRMGHSGERSIRTDKRARRSSLQRTSRHLERGHIPLARYTLDSGRDPVPSDDLVMWKASMNTSERWVEDSLLSVAANTQVHVCTVFLGLDVGFGGLDRPALFEAMVLGGIWDRNLYRYCTWQEAQEVMPRF